MCENRTIDEGEGECRFWVDLFVVHGCMSRLDWQLAASPTSIDESGTDYLYRVGLCLCIKGTADSRRSVTSDRVRPITVVDIGVQGDVRTAGPSRYSCQLLTSALTESDCSIHKPPLRIGGAPLPGELKRGVEISGVPREIKYTVRLSLACAHALARSIIENPMSART